MVEEERGNKIPEAGDHLRRVVQNIPRKLVRGQDNGCAQSIISEIILSFYHLVK